VDYQVSNHIAIKPIQVEYVMTQINSAAGFGSHQERPPLFGRCRNARRQPFERDTFSCPHDSANEDWFRAEAELRNRLTAAATD